MGLSRKCSGIIAGVIISIIIIIIIAIIASSLKKLESNEVGIFHNNFHKNLYVEPYYEGLHLGPPAFDFIMFSSVFSSEIFDNVKCLNKDGVSVVLRVSYQYRVRPSSLYKIVNKYKDETTYKQVLRYVGTSAIQYSCSLFNTSQFQSERGKFQEDLTGSLVEKFNKLDCDVTDLQVNNIQRPSQYENAIKEKEAAKEDIEVAINEFPRQITAARTLKREAETEAEIIINQARRDSEIIINRALSEAQAILNEFTKEAETYKQLKESNGLSNEDFLSFMSIRVISNTKKTVNIGLDSPAKTNFS